MICDRPIRRTVQLLTLLALGVLFSSFAPAARSGGVTVSPAPGTIYFYRSTGDWMSMNGNGSGKKIVPIAIPSYQLHANSRWSLQGDYDYDGALDPNGNPPFELFATNVSGSAIQLTGDPDVSWIWDVPPSWSKDDSFVSFTGVRNAPAGVTGGLFVVSIEWSTGAPIAGPPTLVLPAATATFGWWSWAAVNLYEHDWSPLGDKVVFKASDASGVAQLGVASFSSTGVAVINLTQGANPSWSLDGSRIAFDRGEIWTIKPDGTGAVRLTKSTLTSTEERRQTGPTWSPDGAFLAFTEVITKRRTSTSSGSVMRIPAAGGGAINLTSDVGNSSRPHWRP